MDNKPSSLNFYSKLNDYKSLSIQNDIKKFILTDLPKLEKEKSKEDLSKEYQKFITQLISSFCKIWQIKLTYQTEPIYHELCDSFESLLTKQLYTKFFCSTRKEKESDYKFDCLLAKYNFITPAMLEINEAVIDNINISTAINKLAMINQFKSPKDKMMTFINVVGILSFMYSTYSKKETSTGAEEILPLVIFTIIKSKIPKLKSNLNYYLLFRYSTRIVYIEDYYLNTFNAVIDFIDKMSRSDLIISEDDYNQEINKYEALQKEKPNIRLNLFSINQDEIMLLKYFSHKPNDETKTNDKDNNEISDSSRKGNIDINTRHLFNIDFEKLYVKYYSKEHSQYTPFQYLQLVNDFKIILKLIDSFIQTIKA